MSRNSWNANHCRTRRRNSSSSSCQASRPLPQSSGNGSHPVIIPTCGMSRAQAPYLTHFAIRRRHRLPKQMINRRTNSIMPRIRTACTATTSFIWFLTDDEIPSVDACEDLLRDFDPLADAVSHAQELQSNDAECDPSEKIRDLTYSTFKSLPEFVKWNFAEALPEFLYTLSIDSSCNRTFLPVR